MVGYLSVYLRARINGAAYPLYIAYDDLDNGNVNQHGDDLLVCTFLVGNVDHERLGINIDSTNAYYSSRNDDIGDCIDRIVEDCYRLMTMYPPSTIVND